MGVVTSGVFPVHAGNFEVNTGTKEEPQWAVPAEIEEINVVFEEKRHYNG